ncbi:MAG TPA: AAA family ATPase [Candidatus Binatia bacterium]|jgi:general secretion pathway protein A|nr:AAA family ATPase [Candidatus Binatia bacterium]
MYRAFFGLREPPFQITPDPRFLYRNPVYDEAIAALADGILERDGFLALVGEVGTGKTTIQRHLLEALPSNVRTVLLLHPTVTFDETLDHVLLELGIPVEGASKLILLQRLNEYLIEHTNAGGNVALLFDEAQALEPAALDELCMLADLRTDDDRPSLQILLAGQPELEARLELPENAAVRDRIAVHVRLFPLAVDEVTSYIRTRLEHAGALDPDIFTPIAIARIAELSGGIPRLVNVLCDAALVGAYAVESRRVTLEIVDEAWADYAPLHGGEAMPMPSRPAYPALPAPPPVAVVEAPVERPPAPPRRRLLPIAASMAIIAAGTAGVLAWRTTPPPESPPVRARALPLRVVGPVPPAVQEPVAVPAPVPEPEPEPVAAPELAEPVDPPPSPAEALRLVDAFRRAAETHDLAGLRALLAPDAPADAVTADYEQRFAHSGDLAWMQPRADVEPRGERVAVRAPFVITYRNEHGRAVELRGSAAWEIARVDGTAMIVAHSLSSDTARP